MIASAHNVLDTNSHRPKYETITINLQGYGGQQRGSMQNMPRESDIDIKEWSIQWTPPKCQAACWGVLKDKKEKRCDENVHDKKEGRLTSVLALFLRDVVNIRIRKAGRHFGFIHPMYIMYQRLMDKWKSFAKLSP